MNRKHKCLLIGTDQLLGEFINIGEINNTNKAVGEKKVSSIN